jgi:hypothetical protein
MAVLNGVFRAGRDDAGMSGGAIWEAFVIDDREYGELVAALAAHGYEPLPADPPEWVGTRADWQIWEHELHTGHPSDEHRRLRARSDEARRAWDSSFEEAVEHQDFPAPRPTQRGTAPGAG